MIRKPLSHAARRPLALPLIFAALPFVAVCAFGQASATEASPTASPAAANAPVDAAAGGATAERIIVTGSYIPTAETESGLPVTVYTAEVLRKEGANNPVEGLRQLPSFVGAAGTENDSNAGDGAAAINLRGLGQQNTLILINGRRAFLGLGFNGSPDINALSLAAIAHTDVLKDGASAIYGSDAVAGVVNFVMLDGPGEAPYQGAEIFALYGNTTDADAHVRQAYIRGGVTGLDGKLEIAAAGEYYSRAAIFSRDRTISTSGDLSNDSTGLGLGGINNNSPTYGGRVSVAPGGPFPVSGELVLNDLSEGGAITPASYRPFTQGSDPSQFNFRAFTPAIPAQEFEKYFVSGRYKIFGDGMQLYGDLLYSKTKQDNAAAGSPFAIGGQESPYNPFGTFLNNVRYRTVNELGLRGSFYDADYYRYTVGLNGDFSFSNNPFISHFGYDTGFVYERYQVQRIDRGDAQFTPLDAEIAAGNFNPFIGVNAPLTGEAPTYTIDPVTGLSVPTGLTQSYDNTAAAQRAAYLGHSFFYERDYLADVRMNAHFFPNLWNGGIDLAGGYEHRELAQHSVPDPVQANGDQLGFDQAPNTKTTQTVDSVFGEIAVPFVTSAMNIPFVHSFEAEFAYRFESFEDQDNFIKSNRASFDNGGTPRLTVRFQPISDLTLRGSWGQSFLSPTPTQLFNPVTQNAPVIFDPVNKVTLQPIDGVFQAGSPTLTPEQTDSYTAGLVYSPRYLSGLTVTVDWYQSYTKNLILLAPFAAQVLASEGIVDPDGFGNGSGTTAGPGGPGNGITRDSSGTLIAIDADNLNAGFRLVQGIDVTTVYQIPTQNLGQFTLSAGWNHFFTWKAQPGVGEAHNFLGDFSAAFPLAPGGIPFNKGFLRAEWEWKGFDFVATGNYISDLDDDPNFILGNTLVPGDPGTTNNPNFVFHRRIADYETLDMQLSYEWTRPVETPPPAPTSSYSKDAKDAQPAATAAVSGADSSSIWQRLLWNTKVTVGVNNVFDRQPPSVLGAFNDNYDTSNYSIRDRYYYISLTKKF